MVVHMDVKAGASTRPASESDEVNGKSGWHGAGGGGEGKPRGVTQGWNWR